jgi:hypothetical protein
MFVSHFITEFHFFHQVLRFMIPDALPRRRFGRLEIVNAKLDIGRQQCPCAAISLLTFTSCPFTTRESGSAFMSQYRVAMFYSEFLERHRIAISLRRL